MAAAHRRMHRNFPVTDVRHDHNDRGAGHRSRFGRQYGRDVMGRRRLHAGSCRASCGHGRTRRCVGTQTPLHLRTGRVPGCNGRVRDCSGRHGSGRCSRRARNCRCGDVRDTPASAWRRLFGPRSARGFCRVGCRRWIGGGNRQRCRRAADAVLRLACGLLFRNPRGRSGARNGCVLFRRQ